MGDPGSGAILAFSSSTPITMTTVPGGLPGTAAALNTGANVPVNISGGMINLAGQMSAVSIPRDGVITSLSAYFTASGGAALIGSDLKVTATVWASFAPDNSFAPVAGATVELFPRFSGLVAAGDSANALVTGLNIPVIAGTRLIVVFRAEIAGIDIAANLQGFAEASLVLQ